MCLVPCSTVAPLGSDLFLAAAASLHVAKPRAAYFSAASTAAKKLAVFSLTTLRIPLDYALCLVLIKLRSGDEKWNTWKIKSFKVHVNKVKKQTLRFF